MKTLPKDKNIASVYLIRKTIKRVFNFMFSLECSFPLGFINAPKKKKTARRQSFQSMKKIYELQLGLQNAVYPVNNTIRTLNISLVNAG